MSLTPTQPPRTINQQDPDDRDTCPAELQTRASAAVSAFRAEIAALEALTEAQFAEVLPSDRTTLIGPLALPRGKSRQR